MTKIEERKELSDIQAEMTVELAGYILGELRSAHYVPLYEQCSHPGYHHCMGYLNARGFGDAPFTREIVRAGFERAADRVREWSDQLRQDAKGFPRGTE